MNGQAARAPALWSQNLAKLLARQAATLQLLFNMKQQKRAVFLTISIKTFSIKPINPKRCV